MRSDLLVRNQTLQATLAGLAFLGAYGFITDNLGHLSPQLNQLLALLSLGLFASLHLSAKGVTFKRGHTLDRVQMKSLLSAGATLLAGIAAWILGREAGQCLAVVFFLMSLYWLGMAFGSAQEKLLAFLLAGLLISLYVVIQKHVPPVWFAIQESSRFFSGMLTRLTGHSLLLGATASGLHLLIFFLLYAFSCFLLAKKRSWKSIAAVAGLALLSNVVYLIAHSWLFIPLLRLFENTYHLGHSHYQAYNITSLNTPIFFLALLAPALFLVGRKWRAGELREPRLQTGVMLPSFLLMLTGIFVLTFAPASPRVGGKVLLYDKGYLNWDKPVFGNYGDRSSGMFGVLPEFLQASGYEVKRSGEISAEVLSDCSVVVVINLQRPFLPEEHEEIWRFVHGGGALLALADHTGLAGIREPFNELLRPVGIEVNFDCAHYITNWDHAFEFFPHRAISPAQARNIGISIGASLTIPPRAQPMITAKYGYSDIGNANNDQNAFLGDRQYNHGELLGDIVLVSSASYGKGKVVVFGDTSTFQNVALVVAHEFVRQVFAWLNSAGPSATLRALMIVVGLLAMGLALIVADWGRVLAATAYTSSATLLGLAAATLFMGLGANASTFRGDIAYIDTSHMERVNFSLESDESFLGLIHNLMRNGFLPLEMDRFSKEALQSAKVFVAIAPTEPFSSSEIKALKQFVGDGGTFLLCSGWEDSAGSESTLRAFGLGLENVPLGPVEPEDNTAGVQFYNAWPIRDDKAAITEALCLQKESSYPLMMEQAGGSGRFIFISDTGFLRNGNLESFREYLPENIEFLKRLFRPGASAGLLTGSTEERK